MRSAALAISQLRTRLMMMAAVTVCCLAAMVLATAAAAQPAPSEAEAFIRDVADESFAVIRDGSLSAQQKRERLRTLMNKHMAMDYIGQLSLGRYGNVHDGMSAEEKARHAEQMTEYRALFPEFIFNKLYDIVISKFDNATVDVTGSSPIRTTDLFVHTKVNRPGQEAILADWRVRADSTGTLKVIDVRAEGFSLTITQREDFSSIIGTKGLAPLLEDMRRQIAAAQPAGGQSPGDDAGTDDAEDAASSSES